MPERVYVSVDSFFDSTGYMQPRSITWADGRTFKIVRKGMAGDCYTVEIKGETRHLFFEKTGDLFPTRVGRWFVEAAPKQ